MNRSVRSIPVVVATVSVLFAVPSMSREASPTVAVSSGAALAPVVGAQDLPPVPPEWIHPVHDLLQRQVDAAPDVLTGVRYDSDGDALVLLGPDVKRAAAAVEVVRGLAEVAGTPVVGEIEVEQTAHSFRELKGLLDEVQAEGQVAGARVVGGGLRPETGQFVVGLDPVTDAARAELAARFGGAVLVEPADPPVVPHN